MELREQELEDLDGPIEEPCFLRDLVDRLALPGVVVYLEVLVRDDRSQTKSRRTRAYPKIRRRRTPAKRS